MIDQDDRVTIGERYVGATESSNLRLTERAGDADVLIAAGWLENNLGALLFRLQAEFDSHRATIDVAKQSDARWSAQVAELRIVAADLDREQAVALRSGDTWGSFFARGRAVHVRAEADRMEMEAAAHMRTEFAMVLAGLSTLRDAREAVGRFALLAATKRSVMKNDKEIHHLVGQVLDVHLDPVCRVCAGRGFVGNFYAGKVENVCKACHGSGHRSRLGRDMVEAEFGRWLLQELVRISALAASRIRSRLRPYGQ